MRECPRPGKIDDPEKVHCPMASFDDEVGQAIEASNQLEWNLIDLDDMDSKTWLGLKYVRSERAKQQRLQLEASKTA